MFNFTGRDTMPSNGHAAYRSLLEMWIRNHAHVPAIVEQLRRYKVALLVLWHLDLEPARPLLQACYAENPRGGRPRDPVVMLRVLLLQLLVDQPSINEWADDLAGNMVLRALAGLQDEESRPGVGTFYDFLARLHDGPIRRNCEHVERPSVAERRRAKTPRKLPRKKDMVLARDKDRRKRRKRNPVAVAPPDPVETVVVPATQRLVDELRAAADLPAPNDLMERLGRILLDVAVKVSAEKGLLGALDRLIVHGDGSPLASGANPHGRKACGHPLAEKCECPRLYSDPDAQWGWDSHRKVWFFGYHFYEISIIGEKHDLPLAIALGPGNASDFQQGPFTQDRLYKRLRHHTDGWRLGTYIADAGHDAEPFYRFLLERGAAPVIPLKAPAPAVHPARPDLRLSERGVPACKAGVEMVPWGSAGPDRSLFMCPKVAGRIARCPLAPPEAAADWRCRPELTYGPTVSVKPMDNPRLCPTIPRNSRQYELLYNRRSGCERSNSVKKEAFHLAAARHRRASFWLIRLHLIAILQHARAWVANENADQLLDRLLAGPEVTAMAA
jgi:hypothetical protein